MDTIENYKENEIRVSDKVRPWDMVNGSPRVPEEVINQRLAICHECPAFRPLTQICNLKNKNIKK
jgi:hypothetical protein